jgi:hypothetical protein
MSTAIATVEKRDMTFGGTEGKAQKLTRLRELAGKDLVSAQEQAWNWLCSFKTLDTHHDLGWLFAEGTAPKSPVGDCQGEVLGLFGALWLDSVDRLVRVGRLLGGIGWTGKTFDPASGTGYNRLSPGSFIPMKLVMPKYRFKKVNGEYIGFHFDHKLDYSPLSPEQQVRSISYANPNYKNPIVLPDTRDELVEILPDVYLGRALYKEDGQWRVVGFFALRQPVGK